MSSERPTGNCNKKSSTCGTVTKTESSPSNNFCECVHACMVLAMREQASDLVAFGLGQRKQNRATNLRKSWSTVHQSVFCSLFSLTRGEYGLGFFSTHSRSLALSRDFALLFPVPQDLAPASHIKFKMATIHKLSKLVLSKDYIECFWSNTKFWGELEKLGANSKWKFYSGGELGEGELAMGRNRYHSLKQQQN